MSTLKERLDYLLENEGITPYKVSKETGISQSVFSSIRNDEDGVKTLQADTASKIAKYFKVNRTWLLTGEGDMLVSGNTVTAGSGSNQVVGNNSGHISQTATSDISTTISDLTEIIKQSQSIATTTQEHLSRTLEQLAESQEQISALIKIINSINR